MFYTFFYIVDSVTLTKNVQADSLAFARAAFKKLVPEQVKIIKIYVAGF